MSKSDRIRLVETLESLGIEVEVEEFGQIGSTISFTTVSGWTRVHFNFDKHDRFESVGIN